MKILYNERVCMRVVLINQFRTSVVIHGYIITALCLVVKEMPINVCIPVCMCIQCSRLEEKQKLTCFPSACYILRLPELLKFHSENQSQETVLIPKLVELQLLKSLKSDESTCYFSIRTPPFSHGMITRLFFQLGTFKTSNGELFSVD